MISSKSLMRNFILVTTLVAFSTYGLNTYNKYDLDPNAERYDSNATAGP